MSHEAYVIGAQAPEKITVSPLRYLANRLYKPWREITEHEWTDFWAGWRVQHQTPIFPERERSV